MPSASRRVRSSSWSAIEPAAAEDPKRAGWQDRIEPIWGVVANGCHPNRRTLDAIREAGFDVSDVEQGELPGVPTLVRPYISGRAHVVSQTARV